MEGLLFAVSLVALLGAYFVSCGNVKGFYIWICTNLVFMAHNLNISQYAMAGLFFAYLWLAVLGIMNARKRGQLAT